MKLLKWLFTLKLYVVGVEDHGVGQGQKLVSIHFTNSGAERKVKKGSDKRWAMIDSEADKWLVKWIIAERTVNL